MMDFYINFALINAPASHSDSPNVTPLLDRDSGEMTGNDATKVSGRLLTPKPHNFYHLTILDTEFYYLFYVLQYTSIK